MQQTNRRTRRRGFTLIELMVVITILGLLASIASVSVVRYLKEANIEAAKGDMRAMRDAIELFRARKNKLPSSLQDLCGPDGEERWLEATEPPKDPWGGEYQYTPKDRKTYDLLCFGANGVEGGDGEDKDITLADLSKRGTDEEK